MCVRINVVCVVRVPIHWIRLSETIVTSTSILIPKKCYNYEALSSEAQTEWEMIQQTHNVATKSLQRRCNVTTLQRRCNDVVETLRVCWGETNTDTTSSTYETTGAQRWTATEEPLWNGQYEKYWTRNRILNSDAAPVTNICSVRTGAPVS